MVRTRDCKYFYIDDYGYPICRRCRLFCTPTEDEKCPNFEPRAEDDDKGN